MVEVALHFHKWHLSYFSIYGTLALLANRQRNCSLYIYPLATLLLFRSRVLFVTKYIYYRLFKLCYCCTLDQSFPTRGTGTTGSTRARAGGNLNYFRFFYCFFQLSRSLVRPPLNNWHHCYALHYHKLSVVGPSAC